MNKVKSGEHTGNADGNKNDSLVKENGPDFVGGNCGERTAKYGESVVSEESARLVDCNTQWPSGWSTPYKREKTSVTSPVSSEERLKFATLQLQRKVLEACQQFFADATGSDADEDEGEVEAEDGLEECKEFKLFLSVFMENSKLRNYYEKTREGGEFYCLVCGGIGKKVWNRFWLCWAPSTLYCHIEDKKCAHRAFGAVVCKVLGWDINKLPNIVSKG